jgi:acyl-CoA thioesterase I
VNLRSKKLKARECVFALLVFLITSAACALSDSAQKENRANMGADEQSAATVVYAALGDSTGVGVGARQGGGYVARIFERIKRERGTARLNNFCVSGAKTEDVLREQLRPAINSRPTLVTLGIGINDLGHGISVERFASNYEEIIKRLKTETNAKIVVTNMPDISFAPVILPADRDQTRRLINLFNKKLEAIAEKYSLSVVDVYSETHRVIPSHPEFFSEDGFHPSAEGYEYWAETMWPIIKTAIGE